MIFFTICSRNFTGFAGALWSSLRSVYPDVKFYMVLCDEIADFDHSSLRYPVITIPELGISSFQSMKDRYNITELNTSLKPFTFSYLFDRHPDEIIIYLDPDIFVVSKLVEIEESFNAGADCILTPHICEPAEFAEMSDLEFLKYGIYNFGFCGLRDTPETRRLVAWWGRRLEEYCSIDFNRGLFVDQKWGDYFPAFIEKTDILRHPGYNLAYWNLAQRRLARAKDETWQVNGLPLRFVHFSGNRIEDEGVFTRHAGQFNVRNTPGLRDLLAEYRKAVFDNGHEYYSTIPYGFSWNGASFRNEHTPEEFQRKAKPGGNTRPYLPVARYHSLQQFLDDRRFNASNIFERRLLEMSAIPEGENFLLKGFCSICADEREFITSSMYNLGVNAEGRTMPNWREHLACTACGHQNRIRALLHVIDQEFSLDPEYNVYITEQITPLYSLLKGRWDSLAGSEYVSDDAIPGTVVNGVRHEDMQHLSFSDQSFDAILSFDVLEHLPYPEKAFSEVYRCLRENGMFIFTAPFDVTRASDKIRALVLNDGSIEHLLPPEYHGNPMDMEKGALCFRYFSWGVLEQLKELGFSEAGVMSYWSDDMKYYGDPQVVLFARK